MITVRFASNPVHRNGITLGLSTGSHDFAKLSLLASNKATSTHTGFESHQVVEIKVENRLFHRR